MADNDEWYQQALTPPQVIEVNIRIGVIVEQDHIQGLVEMKDPTTNIQLAQASAPHRRLAQHDELVRWLTDKAVAWLSETVEPF